MKIDCLDMNPDYIWMYIGICNTRVKVPILQLRMALLSTLNPSLPAVGVFFANSWWHTITEAILNNQSKVEFLTYVRLRIVARIRETIPIYTMGSYNPKTFVNGKSGMSLTLLSHGLDTQSFINTAEIPSVLTEIDEMVELYKENV